MIKTYRDEVPPDSGRKYEIENVGSGQSTITDVTEYVQEGTSFGATDICGVGIIEVTHSKNGTIHNLVTDNITAENIKFEMAANTVFNIGDTFTFNGVAYTAKTLKNSSLPDACFMAGDVVFALVNHTSKIIYFNISYAPKNLRIRCNNTTATTEKTDYNFKKEVSVPGITADYWVDAQVTGGSYYGIYQVESAADKLILWFATQPATSVYITVVYMKTEE